MTSWITQPAASIDNSAIKDAQERQNILTKPAGSLGMLEDIACQFAGWQGTSLPTCHKIMISVFAGDHGVCAQNISAFPPQVTTQMIENFLAGGAAISILAKQHKARFGVINMGTLTAISDVEQHPNSFFDNRQIANGTADFTQAPAMTEAQLEAALLAGRETINTALNADDIELFIGGEMGIGNTTAAAAIYSQLLDLPPQTCAGPGTGIDQAGINRKAEVIAVAIKLHEPYLNDPLSILQYLGGLEIAGLVAAYITAAQHGVPSLIDGCISTVAALVAVKLNPSVADWFIYAHQSAEPAHKLALEALSAEPILKLGMRLGEGSGAAMAIPVIQNALALHSNMATFESAGVNDAH